MSVYIFSAGCGRHHRRGGQRRDCPGQAAKGGRLMNNAIAPRLRQLLLLLSSNQTGEVTAAAAAIGRTLSPTRPPVADAVSRMRPRKTGTRCMNSVQGVASYCDQARRNSSKVWASGAEGQPRNKWLSSLRSTAAYAVTLHETRNRNCKGDLE